MIDRFWKNDSVHWQDDCVKFVNILSVTTLICWCTWYEVTMILLRLLNLMMYRWQLCLQKFDLDLMCWAKEVSADTLFADVFHQCFMSLWVLRMISRGLNITETLLLFLSLVKEKFEHPYKILRLKVQMCISKTYEWNHKLWKGFNSPNIIYR